jgi:hypothetical protein
MAVAASVSPLLQFLESVADKPIVNTAFSVELERQHSRIFAIYCGRSGWGSAVLIVERVEKNLPLLMPYLEGILELFHIERRWRAIGFERFGRQRVTTWNGSLIRTGMNNNN